MSEENIQPHRFQPGQSGNPGGRPKGARTKVLAALDALGEGVAEDIVKAMVDKAKEGDVAAGRTLLERWYPVRKGTPVVFNLPPIRKPEDLPEAISAIADQIADGTLSPEEGSSIVGVIDAQRRAIDTSDHAERLAALEEVLKDYLAKEGRT